MSTRTEKSLNDRLMSKVSKNSKSGCWEWTGSGTLKGYGQIWFRGTMRLAHRTSFELHRGPIPDGIRCLHKCDNPKCINPDHLFLGTDADNTADMIAKGRESRPPILCGSANGRAKLTAAEVAEIRTATGVSNLELAAKYGISDPQISLIRTGKRW